MRYLISLVVVASVMRFLKCKKIGDIFIFFFVILHSQFFGCGWTESSEKHIVNAACWLEFVDVVNVCCGKNSFAT